jgi:hypothetical protein
MSDFHWTLGIWLTFLLYGFASVASWRVAEIVRRTIGYGGLRERTFWQLEAILFLALAANAAINGLGGLTALFRATAMDGGWYAGRTPVQTHLIVLLFGAFVVAAAVSLYWARSVSRPALLALLVSLLLVTFILVRAVSLHAVDQIIFARILGVTFSSMIEAGGIATLFVLVFWRRAQLAH